jgi:hypothetical protein
MLTPINLLIFFFQYLAAPLAGIVSVFYLFNKRLSYWHWWNASGILGMFAFFLTSRSYPSSFWKSPFGQFQFWDSIERDVTLIAS